MVKVYETDWMIVRRANPLERDAFIQELGEVERSMTEYGFDLKSITECKGEIFFFLINSKAINDARYS
jgi:hypothetical protein